MRLPIAVQGRRLARTLAVLVAVMGAMTTAVAPANASAFLGILSAGKPASPPFVFSPNFMTIGPSGANITFTISVKNLTSEPQTVTLNFNVHHILTYYGLNVADGQPGKPGITFKPGDAPNTTQQLVGTPQLVTASFPPAAAGPKTLTFQQTVNTSGYFQVDVDQHDAEPQVRDGGRHTEGHRDAERRPRPDGDHHLYALRPEARCRLHRDRPRDRPQRQVLDIDGPRRRHSRDLALDDRVQR